MKKLTIVPLALMICGAAYGQGELAFENGSASKVGLSNGTTTTFPSKTTGPTVEVALFYQADPNGSATPTAFGFPGTPGNVGAGLGAWQFYGVTQMSAAPGFFNAGSAVLNGIAAGANAWIEVVAWDGGATTFQQALASASHGGNSAVFSIATIDPSVNPKPTDNLLSSNPAFTGLTMVPLTPEPTTIALGALGAASLLAFRRKK